MLHSLLYLHSDTPHFVSLRIYIFTYFHSFLRLAIYFISIDFICIFMSTNVCGYFFMAQLPVLISLGIVVSCPTKTILIVHPSLPLLQQPKFTAIKMHSLESQVFAVFLFCHYHRLWYFFKKSFFSCSDDRGAPGDSQESLIQAGAPKWWQRE